MREASVDPGGLDANGDFDAFFDTHYPSMVRSLAMITGDTEVAADAVQDAFIRAYARWDRLRRYDMPEAWVRRVAINRSRDQFRARVRRQKYEARAAGPEAAPGPDGPVHDHLTVGDALAGLPPRQRVAMTLFYLEGLDVKQVARSMGITSGAVKFHLNRGRAALAPVLAPAEEPRNDEEAAS